MVPYPSSSLDRRQQITGTRGRKAEEHGLDMEVEFYEVILASRQHREGNDTVWIF
jgi:hypothetical protein